MRTARTAPKIRVSVGIDHCFRDAVCDDQLNSPYTSISIRQDSGQWMLAQFLPHQIADE
jgi:hypothetical protein